MAGYILQPYGQDKEVQQSSPKYVQMTDEIQKIYYDIGEASEMLGRNKRTLLYWCRKFGIYPRKNAGRFKLSTDDIERLRIKFYNQP